MASKSEQLGLLRLDRFCGHESFPVLRTETFVSTPKEGEDTELLLNLEVGCGTASERRVPAHEHVHAEPGAEVWIPVEDASWDKLVGKKVNVSWSRHEKQEAWNRLYYTEHEDVWDIEVEFLEHKEDTCKVRWTAAARDVIHYDGSKPETKVVVEAWFTLAGSGCLPS